MLGNGVLFFKPPRTVQDVFVFSKVNMRASSVVDIKAIREVILEC